MNSATYTPTISNNISWEVTVSLKKSDGTAYDLTGFTGQCQIKSSDGLRTVLATPTVTIVDQTGGVFKVSMTLAQTSQLQVTSQDNQKCRLPSYDVLLANADLSVMLRALEGRIVVVGGTTTWTI